MSRGRLHAGLLALASALASAVTLAVAAPCEAARSSDRVWTRAGIAQYPLRRIAFLVVVDQAEGIARARAVEEQWLLHFIDDGHDWVPPEICEQSMRLFSRRRPDSVMSAVRNQVFRNGQIDSTGAPRLASALRSQALLTVRVDVIDRGGTWAGEIVTARVELTAALVDSAGKLLWRISGEQRRITPSGAPQSSAREEEPKVVRDYRLSVPGNPAARDLDVALDVMFQRWLAVYPWKGAAGPRSAATMPPMARSAK